HPRPARPVGDSTAVTPLERVDAMNAGAKPAVWFWVVSVLALLWNMFGVMAFVSQMAMTPDMLAQLPEAQRVAIETRPMWATIAFALAVFGGAIGSALLLIRSR